MALEEFFQLGPAKGNCAGTPMRAEIRLLRGEPLAEKLHGISPGELLSCPYGGGAGVPYPCGAEVVRFAGKHFAADLQKDSFVFHSFLQCFSLVRLTRGDRAAAHINLYYNRKCTKSE